MLGDTEDTINFSNVNNEEMSFYRMLSKESGKFTKYYLTEEGEILKNFVTKQTEVKNMNFVVVGAGPLLHLPLGYENSKRYIAIDPITDLFVKNSQQNFISKNKKIKIFKKYFEELEPNEISSENSLYVFTFNVISYIKNWKNALNKIIKRGDIVFVSYWNNNLKNKTLINEYYDFIYGKELILLQKNMIDTCDIDYKKIKYFKHAKKFHGKFVKAITIYT
jgi:hypothetical protein